MNDLSKARATWLEVGEESAAQRIDNFLFRTLKGVPKSRVYRVLRSGDSLSFLARGGPARLEYSTNAPALIDVSGRAYHLDIRGSTRIEIPRTGRIVIRCLSGMVNLDRLSK